MITVIKSSHLAELLKDNSFNFSKEELEKIMETELAKAEEDMDTELIELCLDLISEKKPAKPVKKKNAFPFRLAVLAATAAVLIFALVPSFSKLIGAGENIPPMNPVTQSTTEKDTSSDETTSVLTEEMLTSSTTLSPEEISEDSVTEVSQKGSPVTLPPETLSENVIRKLFKSKGFENIILPRIFYANCEIISKNFTENKAEIKVKSKGKFYLIITEKSSESIENKNTIDVNGIAVSVRSENNSSEITYRKNNVNYKIVFESDYKEAVQIAKTIC